MAKKKLIDYVKASREAGVREYFIRQALLGAGWNRDEIDEALDSEAAWPTRARLDFTDAVEKPPKEVLKNILAWRKLSQKKSLMLGLAGIILAVGLTGWFILERYKSPYYEIVLPNGSEENLSFKFGSWPALEDAQFFNEVKERFISEGVDFIESDLSDMKLRVYKGRELSAEVPILSKGREGSWWETPAGLYQIQSKEDDHFSSFGGVHMPWSMAFQGNFFIHGWPYYPDGEPVPVGYSGGCVRLSNEDAKQVYDLAKTGMPVLIFEDDFEDDGFGYYLLENHLTADNFLAADLKNNFVFAGDDAEEQVPIASLTKLMTALVATEYINVEREIIVTSDVLAQTSKPRLQTGQRLTVLDLLYPLLMESSNEAGVAIERVLGQERFVGLMNEKAKAIGMRNTHFVDTTGSSHGNVSTAQDLFQLAKYLYNNRSFVLAISKGDVGRSAYDPPPWYDLENFNVFAEDPEFVGGKVGMNGAAGETILSIFELGEEENKRPVVVIALGSGDRALDAKTLIDYVRRSY